jgi:hypothetical protein
MAQPQPLVPRFEAPSESWLYQVFRQLQAIENLPDGWDSHGGQSPDPGIVQSGCALIAAVSRGDATLTKPQVHPTPSGGVQFHWESGQRYFEIELIDPHSAHYYYVDPATSTEAEGDVRVGDSLAQVLHYARSVTAEP